MVTRTTWLPRMSLGYEPTCSSQAGLWPCYPIMPRFGLMGFGRFPRHYPVIPRYGMAGLGQGVFGTSFFGDPSTWSTTEWMIFGLGIPVGLYALYSMFQQTKQTKVRLEGAAQRRRVKRAAKYRAKAKQLESKGFGGIFA